MTEQFAYSEDTPPLHDGTGQSHLDEPGHPIGEAGGELLIGADGERVEIAPRDDGRPVQLNTKVYRERNANADQ